MNVAIDQNVRRVFEEGFCVRDIAEALASFDAATPSSEAAETMRARGLQIAGVRRDGVVGGFLTINLLHGPRCGDDQQVFAPDQRVDDTLPLAPLVQRLKQHPCCFVTVWGDVAGYVTRDNLQKPPGRMWLFGMVTLIESRFSRLIELHTSEDEWKRLLSPGRIQKAEALQAERRRSQQRITLTDCLQFADKTQIVARSEALRRLTRFQSRTQLEEMGRKLEKLRNNLAHSQDIIEGDWETIVTLAENLSSIFDRPHDPEESLAAKGDR